MVSYDWTVQKSPSSTNWFASVNIPICPVELMKATDTSYSAFAVISCSVTLVVDE